MRPWILVVGFTLLTGCVLPSTAVMVPSSRFVYPNSNVMPLGEVHGSVHKLCGVFIVNWGAPDGDDQARASQEALDEAHGANVIIDMRVSSSIFLVPYLFSICSTSIEGTAAKMEVGRQVLTGAKEHKKPPPPPPPADAPACKKDTDCPGDLVCTNGLCGKVE